MVEDFLDFLLLEEEEESALVDFELLVVRIESRKTPIEEVGDVGRLWYWS